MDVKELSRHKSPGGRPHPLAFHDGTLWVGSRDTSRLYAIDAKKWTVLDEVPLPGEPFGLTSFDGALQVVVSIGADDDRHIYRYVPGQGFGAATSLECPDRTGSSLASDGKSLFVVQATFGRILETDAAGIVKRTIALPTRCAGLCYGARGMHMISADDEFDVLTFGTLAIEKADATFAPIGGTSADARGLAYDGNNWWTNLRDGGEVISFDAAT